MNQDKGMIYILTNPSFPNYQKIGKTTDLKGRIRSLNDKSCLPFSFRVYATYEIDNDLSVVETEIFKIIDSIDESLRAREESERGNLREREFFAIDKEKAFSVLQSIARLRGDEHKLKLVAPTKKEVEEATIADKVETAVIRQKSERFCFAKKDIPMGATIYFIGDNSIIAEVASDSPPMVVFEKKKWKLSPLVAELKKRNGTSTPSGAYQGAAYFTYNGIRLIDIDDKTDL